MTYHYVPCRGLTVPFIESLKPEDKAYDVPDPITPGMVLRVEPTATKTFRRQFRSLDRVFTIGRYTAKPAPGCVTLQQARDRSRRLTEARLVGEAELDRIDEAFRKEDRPESFVNPPEDLVRNVGALFYERRIVPHRTHPERALRTLEKDIYPSIGDLPITEVTSRQIGALVERIASRGAKRQAGTVLSLVKQLFRWAEGAGHITRNAATPLEGKALGVENRVGERFLSVQEIPFFWHALDATTLPPKTKLGLRQLLVTGVRVGALCAAPWTELELDAPLWTINKMHLKRTKSQLRTSREFVIPLPALGVELFRDLQSMAEDSPFVMASSASKTGHYCPTTLAQALSRVFGSRSGRIQPMFELPGGPVTDHDLRRTMSTHMTGTLGIPERVAERCLNHGIVTPYHKLDFFEERREAMRKWGQFLEDAISKPPSSPTLAQALEESALH